MQNLTIAAFRVNSNRQAQMFAMATSHLQDFKLSKIIGI